MNLVDQHQTGVRADQEAVCSVGAVIRPCRLTIPAREALEAAGATITPIESPVIFADRSNWVRDPAPHWQVALGRRCPSGLVVATMAGGNAQCIRTTEEPPWPDELPSSMWTELDLTPCPKCGHALVWYEAGFVPGYRVCAGPDHHHWQAMR